MTHRDLRLIHLEQARKEVMAAGRSAEDAVASLENAEREGADVFKAREELEFETVKDLERVARMIGREIDR